MITDMKYSPVGMFRSYTREMNVFIWASMINSTGAALMWPLTTIFVHQVLNRSLAEAGFVIMMQMLGSVLGQFAGGSLYYKFGVRKLLIGALAVTSVFQASLVVTAYSSWWGYIATMFVIGFTGNLSQPAIQSFIGFRWADRRDELFNVVYVANNIGVALGTALSGILADISFNLTFILNAGTSAAFAVFFYYFLQHMKEEAAPVKASSTPSVKGARTQLDHMPDKGAIPDLTIWDQLRNVRLYLFLSVGSMMIWMANSLWGSGVAPHITDQGMEMKMYSWLWTLNGILIFVGQPITSWMKRTIAQPVTSQLTWSAVLYGLAYVVILLLPTYNGFIIAMIIATLGEMLVSPAVPAFLAARAGRNAPFYMGVAGGISSIGRMIGPVALGAAYDSGGLHAVMSVSAAIAVVATVSFLLHAYLQKSNVRAEKNQYYDNYS
ncbi:MFS transporter [Paenibacillus sp. UMB4589-SE434]|uniref:MFS transporter n=1 Tax=Paenibacillus sp. UMB4589-SE434 TaxID=3046314 RepID=UPI002551AC13|nr:MFS transporter [Paenibacillus sp. UMB4589-SE434]MDK8181994.1 MFS transporter [Paenibacillus sp. UMB4589-SE434]